MYKKIALVAAVSTALFLSACNTVQAPTKKEETKSEKVTVAFDEEDYLKLSQPTNDLGAQLIQKVTPDDDGNIFVSPVSLLMALSMLQNGAEGQTRNEIVEAMQATGLDTETINNANASLLDRLQALDEELTLKTANSIWLNDNFTLQEEFKQITQGYFLAEAEEIDTADPKSADRINEWVQQATNDKIEDIVKGPLDDNLVMYLLNAVYFKASWMYPFNEDSTAIDTFHLADGQETEVPFMQLNESISYLETDDFQAISLPYGEEGKMAMDIYLPKNDVESFLSSWTTENRVEWTDSFATRLGDIQIPKFQLEYDIFLNDVLMELGMQQSFGSEADFGKLVEEVKDGLYVSEVKQKTYLSVDENGTEAAAVTSIGVDEVSAPLEQEEPFEFIADKPFFFTIRDTEADILLFTGKIANPTQLN